MGRLLLPNFQCACLTVPLDYGNAKAGTTDVAFIRYLVNENAKDLLHNPGRPGESGVQHLIATSPIYAKILGYNLTSFDLKSVYLTQTSISCPDSNSIKAQRRATIVAGLKQPERLLGAGFGIIPPKSQLFPGFKTITLRTPVLFINTLGDPVTPASSVHNMKKLFTGPDAIFVVGPGHGYESALSKCANAIIAKYFADGTVPDKDVLCKTNVKPRNHLNLSPSLDWCNGDHSGFGIGATTTQFLPSQSTGSLVCTMTSKPYPHLWWGIASLFLAHALRRSNIAFRIFERDASIVFCDQGHRLRLSPEGLDAIESVLGPEGFQDFY
ncbi:hypothetical protein GQ44DRAFT_829351 [Phaeosphaeriaceae sp. PMI808]|nr:hypothetical protein GQ44DRAFT_829351 [Phaeosphaeriaceae sp. PMI808]